MTLLRGLFLTARRSLPTPGLMRPRKHRARARKLS